MIDQLTFRDEVHEASVGDVDAVLDFEPAQLGASPRDDGQASIGQPRAPVQGQTLRRVLGRVSRQQPHDRRRRAAPAACGFFFFCLSGIQPKNRASDGSI